ncbi:MAG: hypothetical protein DMF44_12270 [Verrucomicrobia bacterium]|nr:MAG: hypothetical protein DMF44_12270 [Verrucomicrobiota bacterium]
MLFQQWGFNIQRSPAGISLPNCAGDHLDSEKQQDKGKRAPTETLRTLSKRPEGFLPNRTQELIGRFGSLLS